MGGEGVERDNKGVSYSIGLKFGFFFQAEDGIRGLVRSRGLGDVYKRQGRDGIRDQVSRGDGLQAQGWGGARRWRGGGRARGCLLYTSDAADDLLCVDLGGRRLIKKKQKYTNFYFSNVASMYLLL